MYSQDEDQEEKVAVMIAVGVAIFAAVGVIGLVALTGNFGGHKAAPVANVAEVKVTTTTVAAPVAAVAAAAMNLKDDESAVVVQDNVVKFYFASGKADIAKGANEALVDVVKGIKAGQKATISGYHDSTGDPAKNAELAKQRATTVRDTLIALGATEAQLELKKPEQAAQTGSNAEARRVEVMLVK